MLIEIKVFRIYSENLQKQVPFFNWGGGGARRAGPDPPLMCETWHWDTLVITLHVQYGVGQRHWDGPLHIIKIIELKKLIYFNVKGKLTKIGDSTRKYSLSQLTSTVFLFLLVWFVYRTQWAFIRFYQIQHCLYVHNSWFINTAIWTGCAWI